MKHVVDKILLPTDFSEHGKYAVPWAVDMAQKYGAELHVIHVFDEGAFEAFYFNYAGETEEYFEKVRRGFQEEVDNYLADFDTDGLSIVPVLSNGNPFVEVVKYAKENGVDIIVMGTHGRTGMAHALLGSIAEKVVRKAHCPVLTVRSPEFEFVPPA